MSSLTRMLSVLDHFDSTRPVMGIDELHALLGSSRSTVFRYLRELCAAALLTRAKGGYTIGPKVIELDYHLRQCDPMLKAALPVMQELRRSYDCDVLLVVLSGGRIIASHHEHGSDAPMVGYSRGRPMPLFRGAAPKVILSMLPARQQRRHYTENPSEISSAGLGETWPEFRASLAAIRRAGHAISIGELDVDNVGIAAPVDPQDGVPGALVLVLRRTRYAIADKAVLVELVKEAAQRVRAAMAERVVPLTSMAAPGVAAPPARRPKRAAA